MQNSKPISDKLVTNTAKKPIKQGNLFKEVLIMGLSRLIKVCKECPYKDTCQNKKMEALAYIGEELSMPNATEASLSITQPMMIKHNCRDIKIAEGTTVTIDLEEVKKEFEKSIRKQLGVPGV